MESQPKFTPKPWKLCFDGEIDGPDGRFICSFQWHSFKEFNDNPTDKANARLIAKAPDLFDACQSALAVLDNIKYSLIVNDSPQAKWFGDHGDGSYAMEKLRNAIAKVQDD